MKILYSAIDQPVPGTKGGSIHVRSVAEGLAALGHDVTALIAGGRVTLHVQALSRVFRGFVFSWFRVFVVLVSSCLFVRPENGQP